MFKTARGVMDKIWQSNSLTYGLSTPYFPLRLSK